jgi:biotin transport system permease protein
MLWPFVALILLWHVLISDAEAGLVIVLRMVTAVGLANLVTMTTKLSDMMALVRWLAAPLRRFGVRTRSLELAVALVVRFTPVLAAKGQMLSLAWRARSRKRPGWRIVMPFTVLAIDDAEHVAEALRARGGL